MNCLKRHQLQPALSAIRTVDLDQASGVTRAESGTFGLAVTNVINFDEIDQHQVARWPCCVDAFFVFGAFLLRRSAHGKLRLRVTQRFSIGYQRAQVLAQPNLFAELPRFSETMRRKCQGRPTIHTKGEGFGYLRAHRHTFTFNPISTKRRMTSLRPCLRLRPRISGFASPSKQHWTCHQRRGRATLSPQWRLN